MAYLWVPCSRWSGSKVRLVGTDFFHHVLSLQFLSVFGLLLQLLLFWLLIGRALARCRYTAGPGLDLLDLRRRERIQDLDAQVGDELLLEVGVLVDVEHGGRAQVDALHLLGRELGGEDRVLIPLLASTPDVGRVSKARR